MSRAFDAEKKLLLIETGLQSVESMLNEELEKVSNEVLEKKVKLSELKKKTETNAAAIKELNSQLERTVLSHSLG